MNPNSGVRFFAMSDFIRQEKGVKLTLMYYIALKSEKKGILNDPYLKSQVRQPPFLFSHWIEHRLNLVCTKYEQKCSAGSSYDDKSLSCQVLIFYT